MRKSLYQGNTLEDEALFTWENQLDAQVLKTANNSVVHLGFTGEALPPFLNSEFSVSAAESGNPRNLIEGNFSLDRDVTNGVSRVTGASELFFKKFDPAGRLVKASSGNLTGVISYDGFGRRSGIDYTDGTSGRFSYDSLNRFSRISWNQGVSEELDWDVAGNISSLTRENAAYKIGYDETDQLISSQQKAKRGVPDYNRSFQYDHG